MIDPIPATLSPLIPAQNSHWKACYEGVLLSWSHFDGVAAEPRISGREAQCDHIATAPLNRNAPGRMAIEQLKLGHMIIPIAATLSPSIAFENSK